MTEEEMKEILAKVLQQQDLLLTELRTQKPSRKDFWDRTMAVAPIMSALIIASIGAYFTVSYNQQQLKLQEIQTIEKFIPHLIGTEKSKKAAVLAISSLGNAPLAAKVASIFASEGTVSALQSIARNTEDTKNKELISEALYEALNNLGDKYKYENKYDDAVATYKKALDLREQTPHANSEEVADNLDKLAQLYEMHGDKTMAQDLMKRSANIKRKLKLQPPPEPTAVASPLTNAEPLAEEEPAEQPVESGKSEPAIRKQTPTDTAVRTEALIPGQQL